MIGLIVFTILRIVDNSSKGSAHDEKEKPLKFITFFIPALLVLIFFFLYKNINPLFEEYTDFVDGGWALFTLWGFYLICGIFSQGENQSN